MVVSVSPNCIKMELIRAISSRLLPSAMQQARVDMERASSQDCKTDYLLVFISDRAEEMEIPVCPLHRERFHIADNI